MYCPHCPLLPGLTGALPSPAPYGWGAMHRAVWVVELGGSTNANDKGRARQLEVKRAVVRIGC